jgi:precorrin-2 dehydrogenase/sirohydrochlorin ferrochelatase
MPLFPLFVDLKGKEILVVGGGKIATRKVEKLLPFGGKITVVAPQISKELKKLSKQGKIKIKRRRFLTGDLKNKDLVVVATDDINLQKKIFKLCSKKRIPVNSVDSPDYCSFIFGSLIVRGDLVIGITTSSKAPALSKEIRKLIEKHLPPNVEEILNQLYEVRKKYPKSRKRQKLLTQMAKELINKKPDGDKDRKV